MKHAIVPAFLAALLLPLAASAADAGQLVDVVATGHGSNVREATKAALRAAVEQVVGTMVDATTLVENDELIEDEILRYSVGMVESAKQIGEPKKAADGFYTVKVKATVKKGQVEEKLRTASAVNVTLDGADLFARMTAAQNNLADAEAMIKDVLAKHLACVVAEAVPGENGTSPLDLDPKTGEVFANIRVRIDQAKYSQFVREVLEKLGPMATKKASIVSEGRSYTKKKYVGDGFFSFHVPEAEADVLIVMESIRSGAATVLWFDKNRINTIRTCMDTGSIAVSARFMDQLGTELSRGEFARDTRWTKWARTAGIPSIFAFPYKIGLILPLFGGKDVNFHSNGANNAYGSCPAKTQETFRVSLGTFTADELKSAGRLGIKVGHMKDGMFVE